MKSIAEIISGAKRIGIAGHERPDGDCIGSTLGLYNYIKKIVPEGTYVKIFLEKLGPKFSYLKGYDEIDSSFSDEEVFDVFFSLDCSTTDRLNQALKYFEEARIKVCIDHHISNLGFGDHRAIDGYASSSCEVLFGLIPDDALDRDIAVCLYSGIVHDTGVFKYSCVGPSTFRALARLVEYDFDFSKIIDETFYEKTYAQNKLLGECLVNSRRMLEGRLMYVAVPRSLLAKYNAASKDIDGVGNQLLLTKGCSVSIVMVEITPGEYKVSMRSDGRVDLSRVSLVFNGGGHERAAGCTMKGNPEDVVKQLMAEMIDDLK